ncbi:unnamed protein product, partial [marine sediment metagenome]
MPCGAWTFGLADGQPPAMETSTMPVVGKNIEMRIDGDILTIKVDLSKEFGKSASGKNVIVASTGGNQPVPGREAVQIGMNL